MGLDLTKSTKLRLRKWTLCGMALMVLQAGCGERTVVVKPEDGGLLPPANPPTPAVEERLPQLVPAGQKNWLDTRTLPVTTWYAQYLNGKCLGFSQITVATSDLLGSALLILKKRDVLEITATPTNAIQRREIVLESRELPNGQFKSFTEKSSITQGAASEMNAALAGDTLTNTRSADGKSTVTSLHWPKGAWGPLGIIAILRQQPMQPDEFRVAQVYVPPLNRFVKVEFRSGKLELTTLPGGVVSELLLIETQFVTEEGSALTKNWVNKAGEIIKSLSPGGFTMFKTTSDEVERIDGEIRAAQLIALTIPVPATADQLRAAHLTFLIDSTNDDPFGMLSKKVNQQVKSLSALGAEVTIYRAIANEPIPNGVLQDPPEEPYRAKLETNIPQLQMFLGELPDDGSDALSMVSKLTEGVFRKLKKEPLSRQFLTPTQAIQQQAGDCKAHSILLIAALRERGIPARAASGLRIFKDGDETVAIYHMWCEAWVNERWLPLDPFSGSIGVGVDHIKFLESSLDENNPNSVMVSVLNAMKDLTIAVKP